MEIFNALNLSQITGGTKLKQGDFGSVLSYSLADENGQEITSFDTKTAYINLVLDDKILFTTTTQVDISRVTFHIDKAVPTGLYYLEIKIDDYIFPSDKDSVILIEAGATAYDLKDLIPNYDVNMTIAGILSDLSQKGININDLKTKIANIYDKALADNAEVSMSRGIFKTLYDRLDDLDKKLINKFNSIVSSTPSGIFLNKPALIAQYPAGNQGIYITSDTGEWHFWNGTVWESGGAYQATAIDLDVDGIRNFTPSKTTGSINPFDGTITTTDGVVYYTVDVSNGAEKLTFYSESFSSNYGYAFYNGSGVFIPGTGQLEKFEGYQTIDVPVSATTFRVTSRLETNQKVTLFKASSSIQTNTKNINDNFVKSYGNKKVLKSKDYQHVPLLISSTTGRWAKVNNSSAVLIPISDVGKAVKITSNPLNSPSYTFLKTATGNVDNPADFATGYNGIKTLSIGKYATLQVPSDAGFLYVTNSFDNGSINDTYPQVTPMLDTIVTVAASNSSTLDKSRADYVATGTNDQEVIKQAITALVYGGTIKLFDGDYNVDAFDATTETAIYFPNNGYARTINFEGSTENKSFLSEYGVTIHVTKTAFDSLPTTGDYNVFAGDGTTLPIGVWQGFANNVNFKNFYLKFYTSQKQMVGINGQYFGSMYLEQIGVYSNNYFNDRFDRHKPVTPAINSIGVISVGGANDEMARIGMDTVNVGGLGTGIIVARAEHLIMRNSTVSRCVIGYQFIGNSDKPLTLINNADEGNTHLPQFKGRGLITSIDFSIERLDADAMPDDPTGNTNPYAVEQTPGAWKGFFDYNIQGSALGIRNFWSPESGKNIKTRNINSDKFGTTNPANPDYLQEFFRTDLNKKVIYNGSGWYDAAGNVVS